MAVCQHLWRIPVTFEAKMRVAASGYLNATAIPVVTLSYTGGNRVSLNVTLFQNGEEPVHLSAITAGGSQAVFFKLNTFGEEAFLDKLIELLD